MQYEEFGLEIEKEYGDGSFTLLEYHTVEKRDNKFISTAFYVQPFDGDEPICHAFGGKGVEHERELPEEYIKSGKIVSVYNTPMCYW